MTSPRARFPAGIIAAGDGSRLADAFPGLIKPLVPLLDRPLCGWVAGALLEAGASSCSVVLNTRAAAAKPFLEASFPALRWSFTVRDTATSWETFTVAARSLAGEDDCVISTADALIPPERTARFVREMRLRGASAGLGLTDFIDDEKPLWADLRSDGTVLALGERCAVRRLATAGLYYLTGARARTLPPASAHPNLRGFWTAETLAGKVLGLCLGKTVDVDRPEDVKTAEEFIKESLIKRRSTPTTPARLPGGEACGRRRAK